MLGFLKELFSNKKLLLISLVALLFIVAAIYTYNVYIQPRINKAYVSNHEFVVGEEDETITDVADFYFFYTDWCPHCKVAKPIISKLKEELKNKKVNGVEINFIDVNCEVDKETADKFDIDGYPTIKLVHNSRVITYDAKPELDTLHEFLNSSL